MNRDDYVRIAQRYDTMIADAMLRACGAVRVKPSHGKVKHSNDHRYRGARKLMKQRHGVRL